MIHYPFYATLGRGPIENQVSGAIFRIKLLGFGMVISKKVKYREDGIYDNMPSIFHYGIVFDNDTDLVLFKLQYGELLDIGRRYSYDGDQLDSLSYTLSSWPIFNP